MICDLKRSVWVYVVHPDLLGFLLLFIVSSSTFSYFFVQFLWDFPFILKKKNTCYLHFFFRALFKLVFYEDFCFWIKYKHQIFFVLCSNYFWDPGQRQPWVPRVTSQYIRSTILSIKWCILIFIVLDSFVNL